MIPFLAFQKNGHQGSRKGDREAGRSNGTQERVCVPKRSERAHVIWVSCMYKSAGSFRAFVCQASLSLFLTLPSHACRGTKMDGMVEASLFAPRCAKQCSVPVRMHLPFCLLSFASTCPCRSKKNDAASSCRMVGLLHIADPYFFFRRSDDQQMRS